MADTPSADTPSANAPSLRTERLLLRPWREDDQDALAAMNADPEVMRYFPGCLSHDESADMMAKDRRHKERFGFGWWALEAPGSASFAGAVALLMPRFEAHFTPCFEIGWRLPRACWGQGYATEAAKAVVDFAFHQVQIEDLVAFTFTGNGASRKVMAKLGMTHKERDDFRHPLLAPDHPLHHHVLYRVSRRAWMAGGLDVGG